MAKELGKPVACVPCPVAILATKARCALHKYQYHALIAKMAIDMDYYVNGFVSAKRTCLI